MSELTLEQVFENETWDPLYSRSVLGPYFYGHVEVPENPDYKGWFVECIDLMLGGATAEYKVFMDPEIYPDVPLTTLTKVMRTLESRYLDCDEEIYGFHVKQYVQDLSSDLYEEIHLGKSEKCQQEFFEFLKMFKLDPVVDPEVDTTKLDPEVDPEDLSEGRIFIHQAAIKAALFVRVYRQENQKRLRGQCTKFRFLGGPRRTLEELERETLKMIT
jgi:hypothetical protein